MLVKKIVVNNDTKELRNKYWMNMKMPCSIILLQV